MRHPCQPEIPCKVFLFPRSNSVLKQKSGKMNALQRIESLARPAVTKCSLTPISALVSVQQQQVRFVRHPRITRPRPPHTLRAHVEFIAQPKYFDVLKALPPNETCELNAKYTEERESTAETVTLFETVLAREALKKFQVRLTCAWSLLNDFYSLRKCSSQV